MASQRNQHAAIMQPYFWPYIGYFQLISACDIFLPYGHISHRKKSWITRNRLVIGEQLKWVGPQLVGQSSHVDICDVKIAPGRAWRKKMADQISHSYKNAPFFKETFPLVMATLDCEHPTLDRFNTASLMAIARHLGIPTVFAETTPDILETESQVREISDPVERKNARAAMLTRQLGATCYLNPASGQDLYDPEILQRHGAGFALLHPDLQGVKTAVGHGDVGLSTLHLLMHVGREKLRAALDCYSVQRPA